LFANVNDSRIAHGYPPRGGHAKPGTLHRAPSGRPHWGLAAAASGAKVPGRRDRRRVHRLL